MLDDVQFDLLCKKLGLSKEAEARIRQTRKSPPARKVGSGGGGARNVSGSYPSRKMGVTIQFDSHTVELHRIYMLEHDPRVLEFYDQPKPKLTVECRGSDGKLRKRQITPDFFILAVDEIGWEEDKDESNLILLPATNPGLYAIDEGGNVRCPPGEAAAKPLGLFFRVYSSANVPADLVRNFLFLDDYYRTDLELPAGVLRRVLEVVGETSCLTLAELFGRTKSIASIDEVHLMIARELIHADIWHGRLIDPDTVSIFSDRQSLDANMASIIQRPSAGVIKYPPDTHVLWDGREWIVANVGATSVFLRHECGDVTELHCDAFEKLVARGRITLPRDSGVHSESATLLSRARPQDLQLANYRFCVISDPNHEDILSGKVPGRTKRMWEQNFAVAKQTLGNGYPGLIPNFQACGDRTERLDEGARKLTVCALNRFKKMTQPNRYSVWTRLKRACIRIGVKEPSYSAFCAEIRKGGAAEMALKRKGPRAANSLTEYCWYIEPKTPPQGDRPYEIGHVDHTKLDIELVDSVTGQNLGRPWLSLMTDPYDRKRLAQYITYDPPSYRSCMMLIRDCVARNKRLPQIIVTDRGPEFGSTYWDTTLAYFESTKKTRPKDYPRAGTVMERLFGTTNTEFVNNLTGNTQITKQVRIMTKLNDPKRTAVWTIGALGELLEGFYDLYHANVHPALGQSPNDALLQGLQKFGLRPGRTILYNEDFLMATLPTTRTGTAKVIPGKGIMVENVRYWSTEFRRAGVENSLVPVRYEPFNREIAYAYIKNQWVKCQAGRTLLLLNRSEKQVQMLAEEFAQQRLNNSRSYFGASALERAAFLRKAENKDNLQKQQQKEREVRAMLPSSNDRAPEANAQPEPDTSDKPTQKKRTFSKDKFKSLGEI